MGSVEGQVLCKTVRFSLFTISMSIESPRRPLLRKAVDREISDALAEHELRVPTREEREAALRKEQRLAALRDQARAPFQEGFLDVEALTHVALQRRELLESRHFIDVQFDAQQAVTSFNGVMYAIPLQGKDRLTKQDVRDWVTLEFSQDGTAHYVFQNEVIATVTIPSAFSMDWLQEMSRATKVVKSRPAWLYPELFDLPREEVWPAKASVAVIGDPYQACDRPGVTIVEYEYAEELVPPIVDSLVDVQATRFDASGWVQDLYFEDMRALDRMYGMFTPPSESNPYMVFVEQCFETYGRLFQEMTAHPKRAGEIAERYAEQLKGLQESKTSFQDGSWSLMDAYTLVGCNSEEAWVSRLAARARKDRSDLTADITPEERAYFLESYEAARKGVEEWFSFKQGVIEQNGRPEAWVDFTNRWEAFLALVSKEDLGELIPSITKGMAQARHWLKELPTSKSSQRIRSGFNELSRFFAEVHPHLDQIYEASLSAEVKRMSAQTVDTPAEDRPAHHVIIEMEQIFDDSFGAFGYFQPGYAVSLRTKNMLNEAVGRVEQLTTYGKGLLPDLYKEKMRLQREGVPISPQSLKSYLSSFERAWVKQHLFRKRTQHAVPIHGYFPHGMPDIDPQDRILAYTSVTMHGWNHLGEAGFRKDIEQALPSLKVGGKYILGPINQYVYFGGVDDHFDAEGLTRALQALKDEGVIDFEFRKGVREYDAPQGYDGGADDTGALMDENPALLRNGESAHSLVITRRT